MAVDTVVYASAAMPDDDTTAQGGAIDTNYRMQFTQPAASDDIEVVSDDTDDTSQDVEVVARADSGSIVTATETLNGTTPVPYDGFDTADEKINRVLEITMDADAEGNVTIRRGAGAGNIAVIPPGERGIRTLFRKAFSSPVAAKTYYEIIHIRNNDPVLALIDAKFVEQSDPSGLIDYAVATNINTSPTLTDRLTAPASGFGSFGSGEVTLLDATGVNDLQPGDSVAICVRLSLSEDNPAGNTTWGIRATGTNI
jgi:hypothetical protein